MNRSIFFAALLLLLPSVSFGVGQQRYVTSQSTPGGFAVADREAVAPIHFDPGDYPGVARAANDLAKDVERVTGRVPAVSHEQPATGRGVILVGTIGKSAVIDRLAREKKIDVSTVAGNWESFLVQVVPQPLPGVESALVIAGSDKRGTIYGIYELSEQMGVSPWYWWADVPPRRSDAVFVKAGRHVQGPPKVKYRGIFINDEAPALTGWAKEKFGGLNSKMYTRVFELMLRLRANYLWPAMWGSAFNEDDPDNARLADEYGMVMGTSHQEPMLRAQAEFDRRYKAEQWNYATHPELKEKHWREGARRNRNFESIYTLGLRGRNDTEMIKGATIEQSTELLEKIVAAQRRILAEEVDPDVTKVPQMWCLYKEVQDYYAHGLRVPDDVTLLWCDDNWGNVRRVPTADERKRSGGAGMYYHFDYVGGPRSYKWINTNPLPKIWDQMNLTYRYGADRIWIVNVGDLKPMEVPIEFFMDLAWDPDALPKEQIAEWTKRWAEREFGPTHAAAIADIVSKYAKYNGWRKPEQVEPTTFSLVNYQEADRALAAWRAITAEAEKIYAALPPEYRDAFYQLVLYPTKASATVVELHITTGRNRLFAKQRRASANAYAERVRELFKQDQDLTDAYHKLTGGKWNKMMSQTRIGYTTWSDPKTNVMPEVAELDVPETASLGVSIEGAESAWPGGQGEPTLPSYDSINQQRYPVNVFNRGTKPFDFTATADKPWIRVSQGSRTVDRDQRLWVSIDWDAAPLGHASGSVTVARQGGEKVSIQLDAVRSTEFTRETLGGALGGLTGLTAFAAESTSNNVEAAGVRWERIPDYGRGPSGMAVFPVTAPSVTPPQESPRLEYKVFVPRAGDVQVDLITGPTLDYLPGRGLRVAVSFDDQPPRVIDAYADREQARKGWGKMVSENARTLNSTHKIAEPGVHTLKVWMVDPGVVLQKLIVHPGDLRPSYFGPPAADPVTRIAPTADASGGDGMAQRDRKK